MIANDISFVGLITILFPLLYGAKTPRNTLIGWTAPCGGSIPSSVSVGYVSCVSQCFPVIYSGLFRSSCLFACQFLLTTRCSLKNLVLSPVHRPGGIHSSKDAFFTTSAEDASVGRISSIDSQTWQFLQRFGFLTPGDGAPWDVVIPAWNPI